jgi:hypothetical protein
MQNTPPMKHVVFNLMLPQLQVGVSYRDDVHRMVCRPSSWHWAEDDRPLSEFETSRMRNVGD